MLRHNIFGQGYAREAGPASRCKRISRRCRSTDFACLRKPVSDFDLMVIMTQPVVEVVIFVIDMYSFFSSISLCTVVYVTNEDSDDGNVMIIGITIGMVLSKKI